jgi:hypothetical protein
MDLNKLTLGDRVVAVSGILLLIFGFFPWFSYDVAGFDVGDQSAYDFFFFGTIPVILGLLMIAQIAVARFTTTEMPKLGSLTWGQVHLIAGGLAFLLVLLKLVLGDDQGVFVDTIDGDRSIGIFLSLIAAAGLGVGGFLKMQDPADTAASGGPAAPPPPPPTA